MEIRATLVGDEPLRKSLSGLKDFFKSSRLAILLEDTKNKLILLARQKAPYKSHLLSNSINGIIRGFGTPEVQVRVGPSVKYGPFVEFPTRPHKILPSEKKVLFWYSYGTAKKPLISKTGRQASLTFTFAEEVNHPGTQAQPYMRPALQEMAPRFRAALQRVLTEAMGK